MTLAISALEVGPSHVSVRSGDIFYCIWTIVGSRDVQAWLFVPILPEYYPGATTLLGVLPS